MNAAVWTVIAIVVVGVVVALFGWDRYRGRGHNTLDARFQRTDEVFLDSDSGKQMRVWYDASSGKREYRSET